MVKSCIICKASRNAKGEKKGTRSFHRFPKNPDSKALWCKAVKTEIDSISKEHAVCSDHFVRKSFYRSPEDKRRLKLGAVPSSVQRKTGVGRVPNKLNCCVTGCAPKQQGPSFYNFPQSLLLVNMWRDALKVSRNQNVTNFYVCEQHFDERDFIPDSKKLKKLAIPSFQRNDEKAIPHSEKTGLPQCICKCTCGKRQNGSLPTTSNVIDIFHNYCKPFDNLPGNPEAATKIIDRCQEAEDKNNMILVCDKNAEVVIKSENVSLSQKIVEQVRKLLAENTDEGVSTAEDQVRVEELCVPADHPYFHGALKIKPIATLKEGDKANEEACKVITLSDSEDAKDIRNEDLSTESKGSEEFIIIDLRPNGENMDTKEVTYLSAPEEKEALATRAPQLASSRKSESLEERLTNLTKLYGTKCPFCGYNEKKILDVVFHVRRLHYGLFPGKPLTNTDIYRELVKQMEKIQKEEEEFPVHYLNSYFKMYCQYCGESFPNAGALIVHVKGIHDTLSGPRPLTEKQLQKGMRNCRFCNKVVNDLEEYRTHVEQCTCNPICKSPTEQIQVCEYCGRTGTPHQIRSHLARAHNDGKERFICEICGLSLSKMVTHKHHMLRHENKRGIRCAVEGCKKVFNTPFCLRKHNTVVHTTPDRWKFVCNECGKRFPVKTNLLQHEDSHSAVRYNCDRCDKTFKGKFSLQQHVTRVHSDIRRIRSWVAEGGGMVGTLVKDGLKRKVCTKCPLKRKAGAPKAIDSGSFETEGTAKRSRKSRNSESDEEPVVADEEEGEEINEADYYSEDEIN